MTCTNLEISDQILAWLEGALSPDEAERFRTHIEACPSCQASARELSELTQRISGAYAAQRQAPLDGACPSAEELVDFASGTAPPRRAAGVERHLAVCPPCRDQVDIVRELDAVPVTDEVAARPMPADLRDAFRAALPESRLETPVHDAARASLMSAPAMTRQGGGRGWGLRRILAAVATFTVIIGVTTLLIIRADMFGRPLESDETRSSISPPRSVPERALEVGRDPVAAVPPGTGAPASGSYGDDSLYQPSPAEAHATPPASGRSAAKIAVAPAGSGAGASTNESKRASVPPLKVARPVPPTVVDEEEASVPASSPRKDERLATAPAAAPTVAGSAAKAPASAPTLVAKAPASAPTLVAKAPASAPIVAEPGAKATAPTPALAKGSRPAPPPTVDGRLAAGPVPATNVAVPVRVGSAEGAPKSSSYAGGGRAATESARRPDSSTTAGSTNAPEGRPVTSHGAETSTAGREAPGDRYTQSVDEPVVAERAGGASQTAPSAPALAGAPAVDSAPGGPPRSASSEGDADRPRAQAAPAPATATRVAVGGPPVQPSLLARARDVVARVTGRGGLVVRVIVQPAFAAAAQVRHIRVEVVLPVGCRDRAANVRRELFRALPLDPGRGDEVVVSGE